MSKKEALLLIGSPKKRNSASASLGNYFLKKLQELGYEVETLHAVSVLKGSKEKLLHQVAKADLFIVSFPIYVDSLPAPLIEVFELIAKNREKLAVNKEQQMTAIANCGFPEAFHTEAALTICKNFAKAAHFKWVGGLCMGGGPAFNGRSLEELGGMTRHIRKGIDLATNAMITNNNIPPEAIALLKKKVMPYWLYIFFGNRGFDTQAKKFGVLDKMYQQPYLKN